MSIDNYSPRTGRLLREDGTILNEADALGVLRAAPVVGVKNVMAAAASIFAGASARLANRHTMIVYNESDSTVYWGPAGVTTATGFPLLKGDYVKFSFDPSVATPIYFVAAADTKAVRVVELA